MQQLPIFFTNYILFWHKICHYSRHDQLILLHLTQTTDTNLRSTNYLSQHAIFQLTGELFLSLTTKTSFTKVYTNLQKYQFCMPCFPGVLFELYTNFLNLNIQKHISFKVNLASVPWKVKKTTIVARPTRRIIDFVLLRKYESLLP